MGKTYFRDFTGLIALVAMWAFVIFPALEAGSVFATTTATTSGTTGAGVQVVARQMVTAELSLTVSSTSIELTPAIPGMTGGTGNGSTYVNVVSNNYEGFDVTLQSSTSPAMKGDSRGGQFTNYTPAVADTPETWSTVGVTSGEFGFGITNVSVNSAIGYASCAGADDCFLDASTTAKTVYTHNASTTAAGNGFILKFRAYIPPNPNPTIVEDWYSATTTVTAVMK